MAVYLITYDLSSDDKDYTSLYAEIEKLGDAQRILKSVWLVSVLDNLNASKISELLRSVMDDKDFLYVVINNNLDRQGWMHTSTWKWLKEQE